MDDPITDPDPQDADEAAALIPIDAERGLYFARGEPGQIAALGSVVDLEQLPAGGAAAVASALPALNAVIQVGQGVSEAQGLVRLTKPTRDLLSSGAKVMENKDGLGGVLLKDGKVVKHVRFQAAPGAQLGKVLSSVGPAAALIAIQFKLDAISKAVEANIALTKSVLGEARESRWAATEAAYAQVIRAYRIAMDAGTFGSDSHAELFGQGPAKELEQQRILARRAIERHVQSLASCKDVLSRRKLLQSDGEAMLQDARALQLVAEARAVLEGLRIYRRWLQREREPDAVAELPVLQQLAAEQQRSDELLIAELLDPLRRELHLAELCPGKRSRIPVGASKRAPADVARTSARMLSAMSVHSVPEPPEVVVEEVLWLGVHGSLRSAFADRLRWLLRDDERLLAVMWGSLHGAVQWPIRQSPLVFTNERLLVPSEDFVQTAEIDHDWSWDQFSGFAVSSAPGSLGGHDLVTYWRGKALYVQSSTEVALFELGRLRDGLVAVTAEQPFAARTAPVVVTTPGR